MARARAARLPARSSFVKSLMSADGFFGRVMPSFNASAGQARGHGGCGGQSVVVAVPAALVMPGRGDEALLRADVPGIPLAWWLTAFAPSNTCGYGSLLSQGRRT